MFPRVLRRAGTAALLLSLLAVGACNSVAYVPGPTPVKPPPPPVVTPPVPPPVVQPPTEPPLPPVPAPSTVQAKLDSITVGMTLAQASDAIGVRGADQVAGNPPSARWYGIDSAGVHWMIYVVLDASGNVARKGWTPWQEIPR